MALAFGLGFALPRQGHLVNEAGRIARCDSAQGAKCPSWIEFLIAMDTDRFS